ncbi:germin-like protein subfamily 2 member 4 isoform X2 [Phalaenopsis equestris]|uniref:germin-like protein subfamily 2 member 4 isoform X2 n=1 Tax=Phalaenopsis equestris TaxID=78828 RepID=UPI0009E4CAEC|nr:germin-like protein subfamily 2 member 4 isoform X2 [Phalaenopsis equestris]
MIDDDLNHTSQDFCVADLNSGIKLDGFTCKPLSKVGEADFFFSGLASPASTINTVGSAVTPADVRQIPGLNTLSISMSRVDIAPGGLNPPHIHPRATEILFIIDGELILGFLTTSNKLITKNVSKGETFVFPQGLLHFEFNNAGSPAAAISAFDSQLPGTQYVAATLFGAVPAVPEDVLAAAFRMESELVEKIKAGLSRPIIN